MCKNSVSPPKNFSVCSNCDLTMYFMCTHYWTYKLSGVVSSIYPGEIMVGTTMLCSRCSEF